MVVEGEVRGSIGSWGITKEHDEHRGEEAF